jgi:hypothetical protein
MPEAWKPWRSTKHSQLTFMFFVQITIRRGHFMTTSLTPPILSRLTWLNSCHPPWQDMVVKIWPAHLIWLIRNTLDRSDTTNLARPSLGSFVKYRRSRIFSHKGAVRVRGCRCNCGLLMISPLIRPHLLCPLNLRDVNACRNWQMCRTLFSTMC